MAHVDDCYLRFWAMSCVVLWLRDINVVFASPVGRGFVNDVSELLHEYPSQELYLRRP